MLYASTAEKEVFLSGDQKYLFLNFSDGTIIDNDDIYSESMSIDQSICSENSLYFGRCSAAVFKVKIRATTKRYVGLTIKPVIQCGEYKRNLGVYKVDTDNVTPDKNYRELVCYDAIKDVLNSNYADWHNNLNFPMSLKQYRTSFFNKVGIRQKDANLANDGMTVIKNFVSDNLTGATILQYICEINACFGFIDWDGDFKYVTLTKQEDELLPSNTLYPSDHIYPRDWVAARFAGNNLQDTYIQSSLTYQEWSSKAIERVQIRHTENDVGVVVDTSAGSGNADANTYIIENNALMYGKSTSELYSVAKNFLDEVTNLAYTPSSFSTRCRPWIELGDMLYVLTKWGAIYVPILERTISGITALKDTYSAKGTEEYEEKANSSNYSIEILKQKTNELIRTSDETISRLTEVNTDLQGTKETLQSEIKQTASEVTSTVLQTTAGAQQVWDTSQFSDQITMYGYGNPHGQESRYPIYGDTPSYYLDIETGELYGSYYEYDSDTGEYTWYWADEPSRTLYSILGETESELYSKIEQTAESITSEVSKTYSTKTETSTLESNMNSKITQTADNITSTVAANYETKSSASSNYSNLSSSISQKPDNISLSLSSTSVGKSSGPKLTLNWKENGTAKSSTTGEIKLSGDVVFTSNLSDGSTTISGDNIKTGTIKASVIDTANLTAGKLNATGSSTNTIIQGNGIVLENPSRTDRGCEIFVYGKSAWGTAIHAQDELVLSGHDDIILGATYGKFDNWMLSTPKGNIVSTSKVYGESMYLDTKSSGDQLLFGSSAGIGRKSSSTRRIKYDIKPISEYEVDYREILNIPVRTFKYKPGELSADDIRYMKDIPGLIAEEVEEHLPIATNYDSDGEVSNWDDRIILSALLAVVQDQDNRMKELETKILELEGKLNVSD